MSTEDHQWLVEEMEALADAAREEPAIMTVAAQDGCEQVVMRRLMEEADGPPDYSFLTEALLYTGSARCVSDLVSFAAARSECGELARALLDAVDHQEFDAALFHGGRAQAAIAALSQWLRGSLFRRWMSSAYVLVN